MTEPANVFWNFDPPNATTWFYFSFLLAVALFFKFSRVFSIRNWDVITLFALAPGLLLLHQGHQRQQEMDRQAAATVGQFVLEEGCRRAAAPAAGTAAAIVISDLPDAGDRNYSLWFAYLWLLAGSAYLLVRCLFDLVLVQRPALGPNLTFGGLAWLAAAMLICLAALAYWPPDEPSIAASAQALIGRPSAPLEMAQSSLRESVPVFLLTRSLALLCHLSVVVGLYVVGGRHFQNRAAGMAAATFYLLLPYTGYFIGQWHHVWPMALIIWAFVCYRRPMAAGFFLGLASASVFFPALLLPIWISFYWKRGARRFLAAFFMTTMVCLALVGVTLWARNELLEIISLTLDIPAWQPWQLKGPTQDSFWSFSVHWAYRLPISIAYLALVITTAFWPSPKNLAHVLSLSALVLIGIQFWYADHGGVYVLWYSPLVLLMVFRPNLSGHRPPAASPNGDWIARLPQSLQNLVRRLLRKPDSLVHVRDER